MDGYFIVIIRIPDLIERLGEKDKEWESSYALDQRAYNVIAFSIFPSLDSGGSKHIPFNKISLRF